ncbi:MAG: Zn-dependent membrane protease YugP [Candidatus Endobugula sp.]|jgi:Zn-dependent membrane protease YugP
MLFVIAGIALLLLICGPHLWVKHILKKHHRHLPNMPGTGGEFAAHLLKQYDLDNVVLEMSTEDDDHYSPTENAVRLSPEVFEGKSLSAIAVAAHEVGHAIQFNRKETVSLLRTKYMGSANRLQKIGISILMVMPLVGGIVKLPLISFITLVFGVLTMLLSVLLHLAVLPEEWDASFNKALPILDQGHYVPKEYIPAIRQVLKACAFTYVAAALMNILRMWRWFRLIR